MSDCAVKIRRLRPGALLPVRATAGSAGYDLFACLEAPVTLAPMGREKIPTGIALEIPAGTGAFLFARSSLGAKFGVVPANAVGVVDSDYRGEIFVPLANLSGEEYTVQPGERIAQLVLLPVLLPELEEVRELSETARGAGGFGSTGMGTLERGGER